MAVNSQQSQLVKDFLPRFKRAILVLIIALQVLVLAALATMFYMLGYFNADPTAAISILVAQTILGIVVSLIISHLTAQPMKQLLAVLVHFSGERSNTTPPNPNESQFEKNGFKPVLQTLYQLATNGSLAAIDAAESSNDSNEQPATQAKSPLEAALNNTICGFVTFDHDRRISYANKATPIRISTDGVQSLDLIFNENNTIEQWWDECEKTAVNAEKTWSRISNKLPGEEDRRFFDVIASYNKESSSEMVLTLVDRTHIYKVSEEELDFIAFAAHELRGPITVIRGYLDVLQSELGDVLEPDQKELFSRLEVSASKLSGYINNILNTSRYDRRHLSMHPTETTIAAVYHSIQDDMTLRANSQGRLLSVSIPDDLPTIAADSASLGEVFSNLIDNGIKYSGDGGLVEVTAQKNADRVEFAVQDHGIGMPSSVVSNLFQKFYRSHRSRETVAGTGIGLYISKAIVESHGGTISVRSEDGHGSTFTISLPTYEAVAEKLKAGNNGNEQIISGKGSWIKNHNMYRG